MSICSDSYLHIILQFAKDRDEWQAERKSLEESISLLEETLKAEKARTEELNSAVDVISSSRGDVDGKVRVV